MPSQPYPGLIVSGADTDAGKTVVSAVLLRGLGGTYWKPLQSGTQDGTDTALVQRLTGLDDSHFLPEAYSFAAPFSPQQAAEMEGAAVDVDRLRLPEADRLAHRPLLVEGAGGLLVPVTREVLYADLFEGWALPVILVGRNRLGIVNHMLLSIAECRRRGLRMLGFILSGSGNPENAKAIARHGDIACLGEIPEVNFSSQAGLAQAVEAVDFDALRRALLS